jgi:hypothetical protein
VKAVYSGGATFLDSTSTPVTLFVTDYSLTSTIASFDLKRGFAIDIPLTITPLNPNYGPTIVFGCFGLPSESTCVFTPSTAPITGGPVSTSMTITTIAPSGALRDVFGRNSKLVFALLLPGAFGFLMLPLRKPGTRRLSVVGLVGVLMLSVVWWTACGGGNGFKDPGSQPTGMRPFSVTAATAGPNPIQHTLTLTMNLQ